MKESPIPMAMTRSSPPRRRWLFLFPLASVIVSVAAILATLAIIPNAYKKDPGAGGFAVLQLMLGSPYAGLVVMNCLVYRHYPQSRAALAVALLGTILTAVIGPIGFFGGFGHADAQEALIFLFIPGAQWHGCLLVGFAALGVAQFKLPWKDELAARSG